MESLAGASFKVSVDLYQNGGLSPVVDTAGINFQQSVELPVKQMLLMLHLLLYSRKIDLSE